MVDVEAPASAKPTPPAAGDRADDGAEPDVARIRGIPISRAQLPLFIVLAASLVLLIAIGAIYRWNFRSGYASYALSVPCLSLVISFICLLLSKWAEDTYQSVGRYMTLLCFAYSFIGTCFLTLNKPFTTTGNGYFAAWTLVYGSAQSLGATAENAVGAAAEGLGELCGVAATSLVVILATIPAIGDGKTSVGEATYGLVLACLTLLFAIYVVWAKGRGNAPGAGLYFVSLACLSVCWVVMACLTTFRGPFLATGNGYFASWAGAGLVSVATFEAWHSM